MTAMITRRSLGLMVACGMLLAAGAARAQTFDRPPSYSAAAALGKSARGANYTVLSPVTSDGFLRHYAIRTSFGDFEVEGDQLMAARILELNALEALSRTSGPQEFGQGVANTAVGPVVFAGNLIRNPVGTTQNTVTGIGQFFGGIGSGLNNVGKSRENAVESLSGQARQQRILAAQLRVDPFTDFQPLAARLGELSGASAVGGLAVAGAFMVVPGAAGIAVSNVSTANTLGGLATDYSSAQLMDRNRAALAALGVDGSVADSLFANAFYTPLDVTAIVEAARAIGATVSLGPMLSRAASATDRATAYFIRKRMELTAAQSRAKGPMVGYIGAESLRFPLVRTGAGDALGAYPIDILSWTPETAKIIDGLTSVATSAAAKSKALAITGTATPLAKRNLASRGWKLRERASF
jgi:hypothetical protein